VTNTLDWDALRGAASAAPSGIDEIKQKVKPVDVLVREGVDVRVNGERYVCLCPFHPDTTPSFAVFGDDHTRCGCWSCGLMGDVLDLVGWFYPTSSMADNLEYLRGTDLAADALPAPGTREPADILSIYAAATEHWPVSLFVEHRSFSFSTEWLIQEWQVGGTDNGSITIPYFHDGELTGLKFRTTDTKPISYRGSSFPHLYGSWKDRGNDVILCEGESDTWVASYHFPDFDVLGLQTGAARGTTDLEKFAGRRVYLWFDGDAAGRQATQRWAADLLAHCTSVFVIPMVDGRDVASHPDPRGCFNDARPFIPYTGPLSQDSGVLVRNGSGQRGVIPITDWSFHPTRTLHSDEGDAWEGTLEPLGASTILTTPDLASATTAARWANYHNGAWFGSTRDAQEFLAYLHSQSVFLPSGSLTRVAGLHGNAFVLPDETIGDGEWRYAPPQADIGLSHVIGGQTIATPSREQLDALFSLHTPEVLHPLLAWFGAAPLRSLYREFPILMVSGAAGTGKTTLVETLLRVLAPGIITTNLTATTPYAIDSFVASTNAFPVWFDEYRPGGRKDTIERLNQILRDAYTRQPSFKGGASTNLSELRSIVPSAPLIISGEDIFSETSHIERSVVVPCPKAGRDPDALRIVRGMPRLWGAYGRFLLEARGHYDRPELGKHDNPRIQCNLSRLTTGWNYLRAFFDEAYDYPLVETPDFSLATTTIDQAASTNPILDMIRWGYDQRNIYNALVWDHEGDLCISLRNLLSEANRNGTFTLPGGQAACRRYILDSYGGYETRGSTPNGNIRYILIPGGVNLVE
jgi:hypothetical protein